MGTYIAQADVESFFGTENVAEWGDPDGDANTTTIAARVTDSIAWAEGYVSDRLRGGGYQIPFVADGSAGATLGTLTRCMVLLAGADLYGRRGMAEGRPESQAMAGHRKAAEETISQIAADQIRLPALRRSSRMTTAPYVVTPERAAAAQSRIGNGGG